MSNKTYQHSFKFSDEKAASDFIGIPEENRPLPARDDGLYPAFYWTGKKLSKKEQEEMRALPSLIDVEFNKEI
jgi:hypothetical protein